MCSYASKNIFNSIVIAQHNVSAYAFIRCVSSKSLIQSTLSLDCLFVCLCLSVSLSICLFPIRPLSLFLSPHFNLLICVCVCVCVREFLCIPLFMPTPATNTVHLSSEMVPSNITIQLLLGLSLLLLLPSSPFPSPTITDAFIPGISFRSSIPL